MASGFFSRLANLSDAIPDEEESPSIFNTGLFSFGQVQDTIAAQVQALSQSETQGHLTSVSRATGAAATGPAILSADTHGRSSNNAPEQPTVVLDAAEVNRANEEVGTLNRRVTDLTKKLSDKTQQYKDLVAEATSVRAEFDAYRRKAEAQLRQERQLAQEEKQRLEELRSVCGGAGNLDQVYVEGLKKKAHEMELKLRDAAAETQKAVRRQREAEEARKHVVEEKKDEMAEVVQRYEQLLAHAQQRQEQLEEQLAEERARWTMQTSEDAEHDGKEGVVPVTSAAEALQEISRDVASASPTAREEGSAAMPPPSESGDANLESAQTIGQLQRQLAQLRNRVKELEHAAALKEERARRQLDEVSNDALEGQKRLTEKTSELDALKSRYAELQSALAAKEDDHAAKEKDLLYQVRQLEDAVARGKRERQELVQELEAQRQELEQTLENEKERAMLTNQRMDEAESASKEVASTLEAQRARYAAMLDAREATIAELNAVQRGLEQDLEDLREESRQQADRLEQTQRELAQQAIAVKDLEAKQMHSQRFLALREEELQSREVERQKMRALLRDEEDAHAAAKLELAEATERAADLEGTVRELENALLAAQQESSSRDTQTAQRATLCDELERALAEKEAALAPLTDRVAMLQNTNFQLREELAMVARRLEDAQQRLQRGAMLQGSSDGGDESNGLAGAKPFSGATSRLAVLASVDGGDGAAKSVNIGTERAGGSAAAANDTAGGDYVYSLPPSSRERHRFVQDAWQSARHMTSQARLRKYKILFGAVAVIIVLLMLLSGGLTASSASKSDEVRAMGWRLQSLQEQLSDCRAECQPNRPFKGRQVERTRLFRES